MAVRFAVKLNGDNNIQRCTQAEMTALVRETIRQYGLSPSVTLAVGSGNLGNLSDTRLKAGAAGSDNTNFDTQAETADVATVTVTYNKLVGAFNGTSAPTIAVPTAGATHSFPCYMTASTASSTVQPMTAADLSLIHI